MTKIPVHLFEPRIGAITFFSVDDEFGFDLIIPLKPFDSGLPDVKQPEESKFVLENNWLEVQSPDELDGRTFDINKGPPDSDGSIYLGSAHNPVDLKTISFKRRDAEHFDIIVKLECQFDYEGVAENEIVNLSAIVALNQKQETRN
jgi:hypothetical protein